MSMSTNTSRVVQFVESFGDSPGNADDLFMQMLELEDMGEDEDAPDDADPDAAGDGDGLV